MNRLFATGVLVATLAVAAATASPVSAVPGDGSFSESASRDFRPKKNVRIATGDSAYGTMLFNGTRQAIYIFDLETGSKSKCYGDCAAAWPPVLTKGKPKAIGKARRGLLGTTKRKGGATQVTYAGKPLYYYAHEGPGQVFCHDIFGFGGTWLVLHPNGKAAD